MEDTCIKHFSTVGYLVKNAPKIDWQLMFVAGIFWEPSQFFSFVAFRFQWVPDSWEDRFGKRIFPFIAFFGGIVAMFGARLADG